MGRYLIVIVSFLFSACGPAYMVRVNSLVSSADLASQTTFVIMPADNDLPMEDLQFQEVRSYISKALELKGYKAVDNFVDADWVVIVDWGSGKGVATPYSVSLPVFGQTGNRIDSATTVRSGPVAFTKVNTTPQYGTVGFQSFSGVNVSFPVYVIIRCIDNNYWREHEQILPVWETTLWSRNKHGDIREAVPYLIAGGLYFIGKNTEKEIRVKVSALHPTYRRLKE